MNMKDLPQESWGQVLDSFRRNESQYRNSPQTDTI